MAGIARVAGTATVWRGAGDAGAARSPRNASTGFVSGDSSAFPSLPDHQARHLIIVAPPSTTNSAPRSGRASLTPKTAAETPEPPRGNHATIPWKSRAGRGERRRPAGNTPRPRAHRVGTHSLSPQRSGGAGLPRYSRGCPIAANTRRAGASRHIPALFIARNTSSARLRHSRRARSHPPCSAASASL